jgi:hypothetical protein
VTAVTKHDVATADDQMEDGRSRRESVPRTSHAELPTTGPRDHARPLTAIEDGVVPPEEGI